MLKEKILPNYASLGGSKGTKVPILYDPKDPSNALTNLDYEDNFKITRILLGGLLAASPGLVGVYRTLFVRNEKERIEEETRSAVV